MENSPMASVVLAVRAGPGDVSPKDMKAIHQAHNAPARTRAMCVAKSDDKKPGEYFIVYV